MSVHHDQVASVIHRAVQEILSRDVPYVPPEARDYRDNRADVNRHRAFAQHLEEYRRRSAATYQGIDHRRGGVDAIAGKAGAIAYAKHAAQSARARRRCQPASVYDGFCLPDLLRVLRNGAVAGEYAHVGHVQDGLALP